MRHLPKVYVCKKTSEHVKFMESTNVHFNGLEKNQMKNTFIQDGSTPRKSLGKSKSPSTTGDVTANLVVRHTRRRVECDVET